MVRAFFFLLYFWLITLGSVEAAPLVESSIDAMSSHAHFPLVGTLTITHSKQEKIDPQSFKIEGKPLEASFVKDVNMSTTSDMFISIYSFQLPAQEKGLYVLPPITVKVDNQTYQSIASSYEVKSETKTPSAARTSSTPSSAPPPVFRLEAQVKGPTILYPGERTKLFYRILYNHSVDLTRSVLPMIHPEHFQKIGDVQIQDYQLDDQNMTVQELTQEVEALDLGTFTLGPSLIEGYTYTLKAGQKLYDPTLLKSEAPLVTLEVKPFPAVFQPASFTGALGQIKAEVKLESSSSVSVGDTVKLQVQVQGVAHLDEVRFPFLQCQPGFSGFFQTSDLPPLAEVKEDTKIFSLELRPLTSLVQEIPSIEMSSFDPTSKKYLIQHTAPIPLTIHSNVTERKALPSDDPILISLPSIGQWPLPLLTPLETIAPFIPIQMAKNPVVTMQGILWMIPIGIGLLLLQKYWQNKWQRRSKLQLPTSEKLLQRALKTDFSSGENLQLLERAFRYRLWEKGWISKDVLYLEKLPHLKKLAPIQEFLFYLQALQYSADKNFDPVQIKKNAKELFVKIE